VANASEQDLGRLAHSILKLQDRITQLHLLEMPILKTGDDALYRDWSKMIADAYATKQRVEKYEGLWEQAKSMVGLGALPLIPIAVVAGLIASIAYTLHAINNFMDRQEIRALMLDNPGLSYESAAAQVNPPGATDKALNLGRAALWVGGGFIALRLLQEFRK